MSQPMASHPGNGRTLVTHDFVTTQTETTVHGRCQQADHDGCPFVLRAATGWNWWCTCQCHPEPTLADAAPDSGAEKAIAFWRAHRAGQSS